jgi:hypothetical protein
LRLTPALIPQASIPLGVCAILLKGSFIGL